MKILSVEILAEENFVRILQSQYVVNIAIYATHAQVSDLKRRKAERRIAQIFRSTLISAEEYSIISGKFHQPKAFKRTHEKRNYRNKKSKKRKNDDSAAQNKEQKKQKTNTTAAETQKSTMDSTPSDTNTTAAEIQKSTMDSSPSDTNTTAAETTKSAIDSSPSVANNSAAEIQKSIAGGSGKVAKPNTNEKRSTPTEPTNDDNKKINDDETGNDVLTSLKKMFTMKK